MNYLTILNIRIAMREQATSHALSKFALQFFLDNNYP